MVAVAWGTLGYGLFFSHDQQAWDDLEAGGRFAANFSVYIPYEVLTPLIAVVVVLGLLPVPNLPSALVATTAPLVPTTVGIPLFVWWVTVQDYLFDAQPQLSASLMGCLIADAVAVGALAGAWVMAGRPQSAASLR